MGTMVNSESPSSPISSKPTVWSYLGAFDSLALLVFPASRREFMGMSIH